MTAVTAKLFLFAIISLAAWLTGCSGKIPASTPSTAPATVAPGNITGNWQISTTPNTGTQNIGSLSGSINQSGGITSAGQFTTSVLRLTSPCFSSIPSVPLQGFVDSTTVTLNSFEVDQQYIEITGQAAGSGSSIAGQYNIYGGCANGSAGSFTGNSYAPLTGTFSGSLGMAGQSARSATLTLAQSSSDDGEGDFLMSGSATFTGFSCFTTGTISNSTVSSVSGSTVNLLFVTNDVQGSDLKISGTFNTSGTQLGPLTYTVVGGDCNGQSGAGTLTEN